MATHAERVLSAILNRENPRRDLLAQAVMRLNQEHFFVDTQRNIFRFLVKYYDRTGSVMPREIFVQALESASIDAAKVLAYAQTYDALANTLTTEADFKWSLEELRHDFAKFQTGIAITESMEILERGFEDRQGTYHKGDEDARTYLSSRLAEIDRLGGEDTAPEGNVFSEYATIMAEYHARAESDEPQGVLTGIRAIDEYMGGFQKGELGLIAAYMNAGKTQLVTQTGWHCAVMQKRNALMATTETGRPQVMRRILARHSMLPIFDHPINAADIKKATLTPADYRVFCDVLEDWRYNSDYGTLNIVQVPSGSKLSYVENRLREYGDEMELALCIIDYLALFTANVRRQGEREEFNELLRSAKGIAQRFYGGDGIPLVSPWQISREAYQHFLSSGYYTKKSLSDTSEADRVSDQVLALLRDEDNDRTMRLQFLKVRDDAFPPIQEVAIDFRYSYIGANTGPVTLSAGITNSDFESLLV